MVTPQARWAQWASFLQSGLSCKIGTGEHISSRMSLRKLSKLLRSKKGTFLRKTHLAAVHQTSALIILTWKRLLSKSIREQPRILKRLDRSKLLKKKTYRSNCNHQWREITFIRSWKNSQINKSYKGQHLILYANQLVRASIYPRARPRFIRRNTDSKETK